MEQGMADRSVLVLGANGLLGRAAVEAFHAAGWSVVAQVRRGNARFPAGVRVVDAPLLEPAKIADAASAARTVVYAINPTYTRWPQDLMPFARAGMDAAARLNARFLLPGNIYNFGRDMPALLNESTPQRPSSRKGALRKTLEDEMRARSRDGLQSVVIRAGDFFGPTRRTWLDLVIAKSIAGGKLSYPGPLDRSHAWAWLPDLARAFVAVATQPKLAPFSTLHFAGHALTGRQLLDALVAAATARGNAPKGGWRESRFPWPLLRAGGLVVPMWRELAEMAYQWEVPHALDGSALHNLVGELPVTPLAQALVGALGAIESGGR